MPGDGSAYDVMPPHAPNVGGMHDRTKHEPFGVHQQGALAAIIVAQATDARAQLLEDGVEDGAPAISSRATRVRLGGEQRLDDLPLRYTGPLAVPPVCVDEWPF